MPDKTLYGLRSTQRHKELRGIFNGGIPPKGVPHILKPGGRLNKKDGLTRYGDSHVKDKTS